MNRLSGADFLAQASAALADSLDLETTLNTVARLAVPGIADSCAIHLIDERDAIRLVAAVHVDPLKAGAMQTLADPATAAPTRTWVRTIREGTSALLADINACGSTASCAPSRTRDGRPEGPHYFRAPSSSMYTRLSPANALLAARVQPSYGSNRAPAGAFSRDVPASCSRLPSAMIRSSARR